jgi:hypothetical protein
LGRTGDFQTLCAGSGTFAEAAIAVIFRQTLTVKNLLSKNGNDWDNELLILSAQFVEKYVNFIIKGFDKAPSVSKAKRQYQEC